MTATIKFDDTSIFSGFTISHKFNDDVSKTMLLVESYRRLEICLEQLNLDNLRNILKSHSFVIHTPVDNLKDGDTILISSLK